MSARPVPFDAPPGHEWTAEPDKAWRVGGGGFRCLHTNRRERCPNLAVATLDRSNSRYAVRPYRYCADHMYGRWIEDGRVVDWRLRSLTPEPSK